MQQTRLDYFLKEHFVFDYHVNVTRIPRRIPRGVSVSTAPRNVSRYGFVLSCDNIQVYNAVVAYLKAEKMLYTPKIGERKTLISRIFNPRDQGSFTYNTIWSSLRMGLGLITLNLGMRIVPTIGIGALLKTASNAVAALD